MATQICHGSPTVVGMAVRAVRSVRSGPHLWLPGGHLVLFLQ